MATRDDLTREATDDALRRLSYGEANARALELRALAEHFLEQARDGFDPEDNLPTPETRLLSVGALGLAIAYGILEVSARIELLELDAELAREEDS
ncbi:MAG: hypothetical protein AB7T31_14995 [Gemmatimonadales bacterium]